MIRLKKTLLHLAVQCALMSTLAGAAAAQIYAAPDGLAYAGDGSCGTETTPCNLAGAVEDATDAGANGTVVFIQLPAVGGTVVFEEDLVGAARIKSDVTFDTYVLPGPVVGVAGAVALDGDVTIGSTTILTLAAGLELRLSGRPGRLELRNNAEVNGDGTLAFVSSGTLHDVVLGNAAAPQAAYASKTARLRNVRIDNPGGEVLVSDQSKIDLIRSELLITNRLDVERGFLSMGDNGLRIVSQKTSDAHVFIDEGALIQGEGNFTIAVQDAASGGFPNALSGAFPITGNGTLLMAYDKVTDAGVKIELPEVGAGGMSVNRAGRLFNTGTLQHNGSLRNVGAARTEYALPVTITSNLEVEGPGGEVYPTNKNCNSGNENGVYLSDSLTVAGEVILNDSDNALTNGCIEGITFSGSNKLGTFKGTFSADGVTGVAIKHSLVLEGDLVFDESPVFVLTGAANAYPLSNLCTAYNAEIKGTKVIFGSARNQALRYNTPLQIESVQIKKNVSGNDVEIDEASAAFVVAKSLEVTRGTFVTNGLLDANNGTDFNTGATVVVNRDADGDGVLQRGDADRAYLSDAAEYLPRKVRYTGSSPHFTGDEIPGPASGSVGAPEVQLDELEIFLSDKSGVITVSKDFTVRSQLSLSQGILDVGSSVLKLENLLQANIGNGMVAGPEQIGSRGTLLFPTEHVAGFQPGADGIDLFYFGQDNLTVGLLWPPAETDVAGRKVDADVIRHVTINPACGKAMTVSLREDDLASRINGNLVIGGETPGRSAAKGRDVGTLDIAGTVLEMNATGGNDTVLEVHNKAYLTDSTDPLLASKTLDHAGLLRFIGDDDTDVWVETVASRLRFDFPAIEVNRGDEAHVSFDAEGVPATSIPPIDANELDVLGTSHFTLVNADVQPGDNGDGDGAPGAGGVLLRDGLDVLDVLGDYTQHDGEFLMAGVSSNDPAATQFTPQRVATGGNFVQDNGEFFASGGAVEVEGDFFLGAEQADAPGDALFDLGGFLGTHVVKGKVHVGPDTDPCTGEVPDEDDACAGAATPANPLARNRYFLGGGCLLAYGDYTFEGTGDRFDDDQFAHPAQGLDGAVFFLGDDLQAVSHRDDEDAYFNDVVMSGDGGILLQSDGVQNDTGVLTLENGRINTDDAVWQWTLLNPAFEPDLAQRNNSARGMGVVDLGSRDSYVDGFVQRVVESGNATGGVITGGYLFPVGMEGEPRTEFPADRRDVGFFRPLLLQFPDDLGRASIARVDYLPGDSMSWAGIAGDIPLTFDGLTVDAVGGGTLTLDVLGDQFWRLEFDRIPSFDPNIRVEADDLPNVFDVKSLRLIQWDCDGSNPRLAGLYDLDTGAVDDASAVVNDFINGVSNLTQEGVDVNDCNIIGIASSRAINPINLPETKSGVARVQLINNMLDVGRIDIYIDDERLLNDFGFQTATPFVPMPGGKHKIDIVNGDDADNSNPIWTGMETLIHAHNYAVIAQGHVADLDVLVQDNIRLSSVSPGKAEFFLVHGAPDLDAVDIRVLNPVDNTEVINLLANNLSYGDVGPYTGIMPYGYNIEISTADNAQQIEVFRFELQSFSDETFVFILTPVDDRVTLMGVKTDGSVFFPDVITASEAEAEVPVAYALHGNYPNPFNPSTTVQFDLPEAAAVRLVVVDLLGREVMTVPARKLEAGADRSIVLDASRLASGTYLYRLEARTATDLLVKTGHMMLIK